MSGHADELAASIVVRLATLGAHVQDELLRSRPEHGLTAKQLGVLLAVARGAARSQDEVARAMSVSPTLVVRLVDSLETRGLLRRTRDAANRRRHLLAVTDFGERVMGDYAQSAARLDARVCADTHARARLDLTLDDALATLVPSFGDTESK